MSENIGGSTPQDPVAQNHYPPDNRGDYRAGSYPQGDVHASGRTSDREWARRRIIRRRGLITHTVAYFVVNLFLVVIWLFTGAGYFWPGWVIAGWGVGLLLDAASVLLQTDITEEQIDRELRNRKP